jgi:hypothetical protein
MHALHHMSLAELERKKFPHHQSQAGSSLLHCMGQVRHVRQPNKPAISYAEGLAEGRCRQPNASLIGETARRPSRFAALQVQGLGSAVAEEIRGSWAAGQLRMGECVSAWGSKTTVTSVRKARIDTGLSKSNVKHSTFRHHRLDAKIFFKIFRFPVTSNL